MYTAKNQFAINSVQPSDRNILDVGCGTGQTAREIKHQYPDVRIVGLNFSAAELKHANEFLDLGVETDLNHPENLNLNEQFDLIICSHVLEHLISPKQLIHRLESCLSNEGRMVLVVPNFGIWKARLRVLLGQFRYEEHGLYDRTHLRFFTYYNFIDEVVPDILHVESRFTGGHFPMPLIRRYLPKSLIRPIDKLAIKILPNLFSHEIGIVLKRR